jgi:hypothetical protein
VPGIVEATTGGLEATLARSAAFLPIGGGTGVKIKRRVYALRDGTVMFQK